MKKHRYDICIVGGLGHVGLPLGIVFASKGLKVVLQDINEKVALTVREGKMPFIEHGAEPILKDVLKRKLLEISLNKEIISKCKFIIITIGTPVDEYLNPKTREFLEFIYSIKPLLDKSQTIIVRSSIFPRTCEKILDVLGGEGWNLAYCPERIVQGYAVEELKKLPQIVAGFTEKAITEASKLFSMISKKIVKSSIEEAELVKLFSNSWRYIQFAVANQFYMIAEEAGQNYDEIRRIMVDGYDRAKTIPGAGFAAGPCLLKDTMQLSSFYNNSFLLGQASMNINEGLPNFIVNNLKRDFKLKDKIVGILGMAFKANVDDIRDSLSYKLAKILRFEGADVLCSDPYVSDNTLISKEELIVKSDIIIIGAPHGIYEGLKINESKKLIDLWNISKNSRGF